LLTGLTGSITGRMGRLNENQTFLSIAVGHIRPVCKK